MVVLQLPALPPAPRIGLDERSSTGRLPSRPWTVQHDRRALAPPLVQMVAGDTDERHDAEDTKAACEIQGAWRQRGSKDLRTLWRKARRLVNVVVDHAMLQLSPVQMQKWIKAATMQV